MGTGPDPPNVPRRTQAAGLCRTDVRDLSIQAGGHPERSDRRLTSHPRADIISTAIHRSAVRRARDFCSPSRLLLLMAAKRIALGYRAVLILTPSWRAAAVGRPRRTRDPAPVWQRG